MKKIILIGLLAGVCMAVIGFIVNFIVHFIFPSFEAIYANTEIFIGWEDPRMWLFWLYPIASGIGLAWLYGMLPSAYQKPRIILCVTTRSHDPPAGCVFCVLIL